MKILLLLLLFFHNFSVVEHKQVGTMFPDLVCHDLDDKEIVLPKATKGKYTLLGMAFSQRSEGELTTWYKPIFYKFIYKPEKQVMFYESYDVNLYFMPMFTGMQQLTAGANTNKIKANVDKKLQPYILLYKGDFKKYKDILAVDKKDTPYFFVLDESGKIVYATSGPYSDEKMAKIESIIDDF